MEILVIDSPEAQRDLRDIKRYIARDSPQAAERFGRWLFSKMQILRTHPEIGRVVPELGDISIREIITKNYRVIYEVDLLNGRVIILSYWHAARGIPNGFH